jgi:hypothetical protein
MKTLEFSGDTLLGSDIQVPDDFTVAGVKERHP